MKKQNMYALLVIMIMIATAILSLFYLPAEIDVQWNESGVSNTASKFLVFVFPVLSIICYLLNNAKSDFVGLLIPVFLFAAQLLITVNALGYINMTSINYRLVQTIALLIVGVMMTVYGNSLPKFAKNYYIGVKIPQAYYSDDLWTKTQRFAGKIWFFSGLVIMMLSFIKWKGISIIVVCMLILIVLTPRIYCKYLCYRMKENNKEQ